MSHEAHEWTTIYQHAFLNILNPFLAVLRSPSEALSVPVLYSSALVCGPHFSSVGGPGLHAPALFPPPPQVRRHLHRSVSPSSPLAAKQWGSGLSCKVKVRNLL